MRHILIFDFGIRIFNYFALLGFFGAAIAAIRSQKKENRTGGNNEKQKYHEDAKINFR